MYRGKPSNKSIPLNSTTSSESHVQYVNSEAVNANFQSINGFTFSRRWLKFGYCMCVFLYATGFSALNLVLPFMIKDLLETSTTLKSELWYAFGLSGYGVTKSIVSPLVGYFSDRVGRADSLLVMLICQGVVTALMATSNSFPLLCFWRFLQGCFGTCGLLITAIIPELIDSKSSGASDYHSYFINGWGVSKLSGGALVLLLRGNFIATAVCGGISMIIAALFFQFLVRPHMKVNAQNPHKPKKGFASAMKQATGYRIVSIIWIMQLLTPKLDMVPLLKKNFASGAIAMASMSSYSAAFGAVATFLSLSSWASRKFGPKPVIIVGCALNACLTLIIPQTSDQSLLLVQIGLSIVEAICFPVRNAFLDSHSSAESIGAFTGFAHLIKGLSGISSQFFASLLSGVDISLPYVVRGVLVGVEAFLFGY